MAGPPFVPAAGESIFAIHMKTGRMLTPATLFPFAQVALVHLATTLKSLYGMEAEVIGIPAEQRPRSGRGGVPDSLAPAHSLCPIRAAGAARPVHS